MTTIASQRILAIAQRGLRRDLTDALKQVASRISGIIVRYSGADGVIQPDEEQSILQQSGDVVTRFFVGVDGRNAFARDGVTPLATYPRLLNKWYAFTVWQVSQGHVTQMRAALKNSPDVAGWLGTAQPKRETYNPVIDPLRQWIPMHQWNDPNGYRLNDRIWQTGTLTRQQIDAFLADAIRTGEGALPLSKRLEQFLVPGRAALRTKKPYGTDASYPAMRLARTEITRAHSAAQQTAAIANPFVDGMDFVLSYSHPRSDICDEYATLTSSGDRLKDPYPPEEVPIPAQDTHPQCLCRIQAAPMEDIATVIAQLRADLGLDQPAPITPYAEHSWLAALLGAYLVSIVYQEFQ